ncbi:MAG: hemerythrin domain-containing protein [Actinomycetota bacterium]|nr:hemerythrin domain-containing protein [Actinomycetota bacterium]
MDVTRMLEADHRMVEGLFSKIEEAEGEERTALVSELAEALQSHMELEEQVVYPAMAPVTGEEKVEEGVTEHQLAKKGLADLVAQTPDGPGFGAAMEAVKAGIEHHVEEEEQDVFPELRREGMAVIEDMAGSFMAKRQSLGMKVNTEALQAGATKDQLVEEAQGLDIDGAASMNKDELAEALAAAG